MDKKQKAILAKWLEQAGKAIANEKYNTARAIVNEAKEVLDAYFALNYIEETDYNLESCYELYNM